MNIMRFVLVVGMVALAVAGVAQAVSVTVTATSDDYYAVYLDGNPLGGVAAPGWWLTPQTYTMPALGAGTHVIAIEGRNFVNGDGGLYVDGRPGPGQPNPAGLLFQMTDGGMFAEAGPNNDHNLIVSDSSWKVASGAAAPSGTGWTDIAYNDTGWVAATPIGTYGVLPWTTQVSGNIDLHATWIWSSINGVTETNTYGLVGESPVYFRKTFEVLVPEPLTMGSIFLAVSSVGMYIRRRNSVSV